MEFIRNLTPVVRVLNPDRCQCQAWFKVKAGMFKTKVYCGRCRVLIVTAYHLPFF